jgi:hypothetical protein
VWPKSFWPKAFWPKSFWPVKASAPAPTPAPSFWPNAFWAKTFWPKAFWPPPGGAPPAPTAFRVTTGSLTQNALNISVAVQTNIGVGQYEDVYPFLSDLCAAVSALAEAYAATLAAGSTSVTTVVPTPGRLGKQYAAVQSVTSPVYTRPERNAIALPGKSFAHDWV